MVACTGLTIQSTLGVLREWQRSQRYSDRSKPCYACNCGGMCGPPTFSLPTREALMSCLGFVNPTRDASRSHRLVLSPRFSLGRHRPGRRQGSSPNCTVGENSESSVASRPSDRIASPSRSNPGKTPRARVRRSARTKSAANGPTLPAPWPMVLART